MTAYARVEVAGAARWARVDADGAYALLAGPPWADGRETGERVASARLLAPAEPTKIVCIGSNYRDHAREMGKPVPTVPKVFLKPPSALVGPEAAIELPPGVGRIDHEAELVVVVGRRCRRVGEAGALAHVFGYTAANDVTAREIQKADGVFARAKGFDTFCPVGPYVVSGLDPRALAVGCALDGVVRQAGNTADMVFSVPALLAFVSDVMTLEPGDLLLTGTPAGVGPIEPGQRVTVAIEGVGELSNPVIRRADA